MNSIPEMTLATLESFAKHFADRRASLAHQVAELNASVDNLKRLAMPRLKRAVQDAAEAQARLEAAIDHSRHLFIKPRTVILQGIRIGLRKGSGEISWDDDDKVVELIEKSFTKSQAELLIRTTKKPIRKAIQDLDVATLKKLGCRVEETGDQIVIKPVDSDVDKLITAFLKSATEAEAA